MAFMHDNLIINMCSKGIFFRLSVHRALSINQANKPSGGHRIHIGSRKSSGLIARTGCSFKMQQRLSDLWVSDKRNTEDTF